MRTRESERRDAIETGGLKVIDAAICELKKNKFLPVTPSHKK